MLIEFYGGPEDGRTRDVDVSDSGVPNREYLVPHTSPPVLYPNDVGIYYPDVTYPTSRYLLTVRPFLRSHAWVYVYAPQYSKIVSRWR